MTVTPEVAGGPRSLELELSTGTVPLGFAREGTALYLVARERAARWPTQLLRSGVARARLGGATLEGGVEMITDPAERTRVLGLFRERYGERDYERWYARPARVLRVRLDDVSGPRDESTRYYDWLRAEFDNVAEEYDRHITGNRINRLLRDRSLAELRRSFATAPRLLEVGCGSGMETLPLLEDGHELVCVDISSRMLEVVREKARRVGLLERLETVHRSAAELPGLVDKWGTGELFDGAYSTYGALNCEADLTPIASAFGRLLRHGARLVAGVYNRYCLFELLGYGLTGRWSRARARAQRPIPVGSSRFCVDVFAFSVPEFRAQFSPWFSVERLEGVPILLPPSDLASYAERFGSGFPRLARWDRAVAEKWPFRLLGDHFLMTLRRREDGPD